MKLFLVLFAFTLSIFAETCQNTDILGVFPKIDGMSCDNYALMISFTSIVAAGIFWSLVTK